MEQRKGGFNCTEFNLVVSCQHRYPEIQTCLKPCSISLLDPRPLIPSPQREMHYSERKARDSNPAPSTLFLQILRNPYPPRVSEEPALQRVRGGKRPSMWVFNGNPTPRSFVFDLTVGIRRANVKGGVRDLFLVVKFPPSQGDTSSLTSEGSHWIPRRGIMRSASVK